MCKNILTMSMNEKWATFVNYGKIVNICTKGKIILAKYRFILVTLMYVCIMIDKPIDFPLLLSYHVTESF